MIQELVWDSKLFGKKMGKLILTPETINRLHRTLKDARREGFAYLTCRLFKQDPHLISALESAGFHLVDIGVIWIGNTGHLLKNLPRAKMANLSILEAGERDIPAVKRLATSLFTDSRFYNDPFFTSVDADKLFQTWIANSVRGAAADIVFFIPQAGFITCRKLNGHQGEIVLIGILSKKRGLGIGTQLLKHSLLWFRKKKISQISVRTQLKNTGSMNFYQTVGFSFGSYDLVFSRNL